MNVVNHQETMAVAWFAMTRDWNLVIIPGPAYIKIRSKPYPKRLKRHMWYIIHKMFVWQLHTCLPVIFLAVTRTSARTRKSHGKWYCIDFYFFISNTARPGPEMTSDFQIDVITRLCYKAAEYFLVLRYFIFFLNI